MSERAHGWVDPIVLGVAAVLGFVLPPALVRIEALVGIAGLFLVAGDHARRIRELESERESSPSD